MNIDGVVIGEDDLLDAMSALEAIAQVQPIAIITWRPMMTSLRQGESVESPPEFPLTWFIRRHCSDLLLE